MTNGDIDYIEEQIRKMRAANSPWPPTKSGPALRAYTRLESLRVPVTPPTPPPASSGIYWGVYENAPGTMPLYYGPTDPAGHAWWDGPWSIALPGNTWDRLVADMGIAPAILHYGQPFPSRFDASLASQVVAKGCIPLLDAGEGISLNDIVSGSLDAALTAWGRAAGAWGHPIFFRPFWEMNGGWYPWGLGTPAATYVAAWRRMHDLIAPLAPNVTWVWCPNVGAIAEAKARYPGDPYVDWTALDGYSDTPTPIPFYDVFADSYANLLALAPSKPILIPETGCMESAGKAAWVKDALTVQLPTNFPRVRGVCWFNWHITENGKTKTWEIQSSPATLAAVKSALAGGYFKGASSVPASGKVPIP